MGSSPSKPVADRAKVLIGMAPKLRDLINKCAIFSTDENKLHQLLLMVCAITIEKQKNYLSFERQYNLPFNGRNVAWVQNYDMSTADEILRIGLNLFDSNHVNFAVDEMYM